MILKPTIIYMDTKMKILIPFLIFLVTSAPCFSATYYVKNGGNDGAAGTSDALAWASLSKVNNTSFSPGDFIYFKRGSSWSGSLSPSSSGTSGNVITYGAYGSGALPILNGSGNHTGDTISISNISWITIEYLDIRNGDSSIYLAGDSNYVTIDHNEIGNGATWGIATGDPNSVDSLTVSNNIIDSHSTHDGGDGDCPIHGAEAYEGIRGNEGTNNARIFNNTLINWGHDHISFRNFGGSNPMSNNWIYNNHIYMTDVMVYGRGVEISTVRATETGNKFYNNLIENTDTVNQINGAGTLFAYNIINTVSDGECITVQGFSSPDKPINMKFYNNVFANCANVGLKFLADQAAETGNEVKNNIFYNNGNITGGGIQLFVSNSSIINNNTFQNNIFYNGAVTNLISYRGTGLTVSQFNVADSNGDVISGNIGSNPLFLSSTDFHLQSGSPAINAGLNVGLTNDYEGNPITGNPEIGAYELGGDTTPPQRDDSTPGSLPSGTTQYNLTLTTNENATCKFDNVVGTTYDNMPNTFGTTGGTSHSTIVGATSYSDNFNRANESPLASGWTAIGTETVAMRLVSNQAFGTDNGVSNGSYYSSGSFASDQFSGVTVGGNATGPIVRVQTGQSYPTGYLLLEGTDVYAGYLTIWRGNGNGSQTLLSQTSGSVTAGDTLKIRTNGNSITAYKNDVILSELTVTDGTFSGGRAGIYSNRNDIYADNWSGGGLNALADGQTYNFYVRCSDTAGNKNPDDYLISFSIQSGGEAVHTLGNFTIQGVMQ